MRIFIRNISRQHSANCHPFVPRQLRKNKHTMYTMRMTTIPLLLCMLGVVSASVVSVSNQENITAMVGVYNSNDSSSLNNTSPHQSPAGPEGRSLKYLSPGQEFLLSVASFEDTKDSNFESLPYLMNILQSGKFEKKEDKSSVSAFPLRMRNTMKVMTAIEKADEGDDNDVMAKPPGLLAKLAQDPANILLAAIIPLSILLAAVIPFLVNQFMNRGSLPSVSTTAGKQPLEERQFVEKFLPIIEGIASFGTRLNKEFAQDKKGSEKMNIFKSIFQLISSIVSENWMNKFSSTSVDRLRHSKP